MLVTSQAMDTSPNLSSSDFHSQVVKLQSKLQVLAEQLRGAIENGYVTNTKFDEHLTIITGRTDAAMGFQQQ